MAEEARDCFALLLDTGQRLMADLQTILTTSAARRHQDSLQTRPVGEDHHGSGTALKPCSLLSNASRSCRVRRSESQVDAREGIVDSKPPHTEPPVRPITTSELDRSGSIESSHRPYVPARDALRTAPRKRKAMSGSTTDPESNPVKYQSKRMTVVYYDGDLQKRFEDAVRTISISRNAMRKGKISAKIDSLSCTGSSSGEESQDEDVITTKLEGFPTTFRTTRILPKPDEFQAFDKADGFLDKAQTLCERAAFQVLRDGDCTSGIKAAMTHILDAVKVGEAELPLLTQRAERAAEKRRKAEVEAREAETVNEDRKRHEPGFNPPSTTNLEVDVLEVDDSEDIEPSLPLPHALPLAKFNTRATDRLARGVRTTA